MERSRYIRRDTEQKRQTIDGFTRRRTTGVVLTPPSSTSQLPINISPPVVAASERPAPLPQVDTLQGTRIDMNLPGVESKRYQGKLVLHKGGWRTVRTWTLRTTLALLILLVGTASLLFTQGYFKLHKVFIKNTAKPVAALQKNVNPVLLNEEGDGRINILLLGRGGGTHDGPDLTDTMMLASINPLNHTAALLSIPRDLWVNVPNHGSMKINAAWETGEFAYYGNKIVTGSTNSGAITSAFNEADQVVENVLGVPIDYNVIMDFSAFQQAVNTLGGVTVNVPTELYDPTMAWENKGSAVLAEPGLQAFTGQEALNYVRSRETTSDFARAQRQRAVLVALLQKAETLGTISNPLKLSGLINAFGNNVSTDLSLKDANNLYNIVKKVSSSGVTSIGLDDAPNNYIKTGMLDGQSIDLPTAGMDNYSAIQAYVRSQLKDPYITEENAKVLVLNGTSDPAAATNEASLLKSYGYNVIGTANAPTDNYTKSEIIDLSHSKDKYTSHYLGQRFNTTPVTQLPSNSIQTDGADFVIIIGSNETTS